MTEPRFLTYADAARYLSTPVATLRTMVHRRTVPHIRIGPRSVRFDRADLDRWIDARRVQPIEAQGSTHTGEHESEEPEPESESEGRLMVLELRDDPEHRNHPYRVALRKRLGALQRKREERAARRIPRTPFVDVYDARRLLNDATGITANAWIRRGRLKRHRVDGRVRISRAEINAILAEHRRRR